VRREGILGWFGALAAGAVAVVCCALGPALVVGSVFGAVAGLLTGGGLVAVLTFTLVGLVGIGGVTVLRSRRSAASSRRV
jgi:hypothetical protein